MNGVELGFWDQVEKALRRALWKKHSEVVSSFEGGRNRRKDPPLPITA